MTPFQQAVNKAMRSLAQHPETVFVGQSVAFDGAAIYRSLEGVPASKRLEFPVAENLQLGYCTGLSLAGKLPVCIFPRLDFLLLAADQLVNHLDKLPLWGWSPKVIIRARVGDKYPLNAGPQHTQDHTAAFATMLKTVKVFRVSEPITIAAAYHDASLSLTSTLIIEAPA